MLGDVLIFIISSFINAITYVFSLITYVIPADIPQSITYLFGYLNYLNGILDVPSFMAALGSYLLFAGFWYLVKVIMIFVNMIPWLGNSVKLKRN